MYVSLPPLEKELEAYVHYWNSHLMRKNRNIPSPSGVPNEMYELPSLYGKELSGFYSN